MLRPYQKINRRISRVIKVGSVSIGGSNKIAVQTMTNTLTSNAKETIAQIERSAKLGADLVRVSIPDKESANSLKVSECFFNNFNKIRKFMKISMFVVL